MSSLSYSMIKWQVNCLSQVPHSGNYHLIPLTVTGSSLFQLCIYLACIYTVLCRLHLINQSIPSTMWRPAANKVSGTNDVSCPSRFLTRLKLTNQVPIANKRRFGLPEEAPAPPSASSGYGARPAPADVQYFNGRIDREKKEGRYPDERDREYKPEPRAEDYYRRDEPKREEPGRDSRDRYRDERDRDMDRDRNRDRDRRYDDRDGGGDRRGRDPAPVDGKLAASDLRKGLADIADQPRKRRSRWGDESTKVEVPGMPVALGGNVSQSELDNYAIHVRLEEINRKLRTGDFIPPPGQRSPSPPPQYDAYGRRTNTVDLRYRKKLEDERIRLIDRAMKADPNFRPPMDIAIGSRRGLGRPQDKVYIPVKEFPEINFFGLLVGPRGNSLKNMERQSGAKISIRGKGSVKEGKERGGPPGGFQGDEDDELHCLIMADDEYKVKACVALINKVIETVSHYFLNS
jgi:splicing factor 1